MQTFYYIAIALLIGGILAAAVYLGLRRSALPRARRSRHSLTAYGLDLRGNIVELGPLSRSDCRTLIDERYALVGRVYETGEEADADTVFGFQRSDKNYIEVRLIAADIIWIRAGTEAIREDFEEQIELSDINAVRVIVDMYSDPLADFAAYWRRLDKKAVRR